MLFVMVHESTAIPLTIFRRTLYHDWLSNTDQTFHYMQPTISLWTHNRLKFEEEAMNLDEK